ncbi:hypothetical protein [Ferruginibacter sp.]
MPKPTLSEQDLNEAMCNDISIQTTPTGQGLLILMCKDKATSSKLMDIFRHNAFNLQISINETSGNYILQFDFIDTDLAFRFDTGKDEKSYPPLAKLKDNNIKFISTGIWLDITDKGRACEYNSPPFRLVSFEIGDAFKQASGVQFVAGASDEEPSVVVLTYDDYDHIFAAEADEAYNRLSEKAKARPHLEINPVDANKVNLKIWDILNDLDVRVEGLNYSADQLKDFLEKTEENHSFAFVLGFVPSDGVRGAIAKTKREDFELITLYGYTHKKL